MILDRARELIQVQIDMGSGYNRNSVRLIVAETVCEHGQTAIDAFSQDTKPGLQPGMEIKL